VGGAAVDIISQAKVGKGLNSQMGKIMMAPGGSSRNCAECIARLGLSSDTLFISGIGTDAKNAIIRNSLSEVGLSTAGLFVNENLQTAAYNAMLEENGDMYCGVSDMEVLEYIDEKHLMSFNFG
jgi:sugar/nucleoside kinase (ribokinase family)